MGKTPYKCTGPSLTQQQFTDDVDVNKIVSRATSQGVPILGHEKKPLFGDFTQLPDLRSALLIAKEGQEAFMSLDAEVRKKFDNDPAKMFEWLNNPQNREEAVKLGLVNPKKADEHLDTLKSIDASLKAKSDAKSSKAKPAGDEA